MENFFDVTEFRTQGFALTKQEKNITSKTNSYYTQRIDIHFYTKTHEFCVIIEIIE
jgi:hypothetical protein